MKELKQDFKFLTRRKETRKGTPRRKPKQETKNGNQKKETQKGASPFEHFSYRSLTLTKRQVHFCNFYGPYTP